jgi:heterotetrameric sarcosine oxidase gamma subunit
VPDLIAKPALGHAPLTLTGTTLAEAPMTMITAISLYPGRATPLAEGLEPLGLTFPAPNTAQTHGAAEIVWMGRDQAFLIGVAAPDQLPAAVTDQSDAWVTLTLTGSQARVVLARLVSLDLRHAARGQAFRSTLNHVPLILIVDGPDAWRLMTFRSMAQTAWHEIAEAMAKVDARLGLG